MQARASPPPAASICWPRRPFERDRTTARRTRPTREDRPVPAPARRRARPGGRRVRCVRRFGLARTTAGHPRTGRRRAGTLSAKQVPSIAAAPGTDRPIRRLAPPTDPAPFTSIPSIAGMSRGSRTTSGTTASMCMSMVSGPLAQPVPRMPSRDEGLGWPSGRSDTARPIECMCVAPIPRTADDAAANQRSESRESSVFIDESKPRGIQPSRSRLRAFAKWRTWYRHRLDNPTIRARPPDHKPVDREPLPGLSSHGQ